MKKMTINSDGIDEFNEKCIELDLKQKELFDLVWEFYKKYEGSGKVIEDRSSWIDGELKRVKLEQEKIELELKEKFGNFKADLEKREAKIREKEAIFSIIKKMFDEEKFI